MSQDQVRNWCMTINNPTDEDEQDVAAFSELTDYLVVGRETSASGTPHLQIYFILPRKSRRNGILKHFRRPPHIEAARGSHEQASKYCMKDGDFHEVGELPSPPGVAEKERWDAARASAVSGDLSEVPSDIYVRYYRTLKEIAKDHLVMPPNLDGDVQHEWWHGESGSGKSRKARETYPDAYLKMCNKWWDGYTGQEVVIIEDFDRKHDCLGHHLKIWADRYAFLAETKGGAIAIRPRLIIVTSNYSLTDIFVDPQTLEPLERRFHSVLFLTIKDHS